jgi:hypothetical protein
MVIRFLRILLTKVAKGKCNIILFFNNNLLNSHTDDTAVDAGVRKCDSVTAARGLMTWIQGKNI